MKISRFFSLVINKLDSLCMDPIKYARKKGVQISDDCKIIGGENWGSEPWLISIGEKTIISSGVRFYNHDGAVYVARHLDEKYAHVSRIGRIEIGSNCFIGAYASIMPNVKIGNNSIVGTCSVVTKDIPDNEVWAGVPAKRICSIQEYAEKLLLDTPVYDYENIDKDYIKVSSDIAAKRFLEKDEVYK